MECDPTDSDEVVKLAWPVAIVSVPNTVEPSLNVTVPVGTPLLGGFEFTVAVSVTVCPNTDGFADDVTVVDVAEIVGVLLPVPLKGIEVDTVLKSFTIVRLPVLRPATVGVNVTLIVQIPLFGSGEEVMQLSVSEKSPVALTERIFRGPRAVLVRVTSWAGLLAPTFWLPKLVRLVGDIVIPTDFTVTGIARLTFCPFTL